MKSRIVRLALVAVMATAAVPARPSRAQSPPQPKAKPKSAAAAPNGGRFLLKSRALQTELGLSPEQSAKVSAALRDLARKHEAEHKALSDLPPGQRLARQRALLKAMIAEAKAALAFTPEQCRRFDQIVLQHRRFEAFLDPEVVAALKLTDAQRHEIAAIGATVKSRMSAILIKAGDDRAAAQQLAADLNRKLAAEAVDLLNPEQKAAWRAMTGKPFDPKPPIPAPD